MKATIGADPELFFSDSYGNFKSVIDLLGGSKDSPKEFDKGFYVLEDNVAAEFNIPPATSSKDFINNIDIALTYLDLVAKNKNLKLSQKASASFPMEELSHPMAFVFGCDPDFNAWTGRKNPRPHCDDISLRSCGGHVHIGVDGFESKSEKMGIVKTMDLFLGVKASRIDTDVKRRELYGKAGAFRYKPYGVEYRTLSNFWIWEKQLIEWVYNQVQNGLVFAEKYGPNYLNGDGDAIRKCINKSDEGAFEYLMEKYGKEINA